MNRADGDPVVIGIGNVLVADDGVGVRVVDALRAHAERCPEAVPAGTRILDGGTLGLGLLRFIDGARILVVVDAVDVGRAAGSVVVLADDGIHASGGLGELLQVARLMGVLPRRVVLVGVQVGVVGIGPGLSPAVAAAVPSAMAAVLAELGSLDELPDTRRPSPVPGARELAGATR